MSVEDAGKKPGPGRMHPAGAGAAPCDHGHGRHAPAPIDESLLRDYLADALCAEDSARVENCGPSMQT